MAIRVALGDLVPYQKFGVDAGWAAWRVESRAEPSVHRRLCAERLNGCAHGERRGSERDPVSTTSVRADAHAVRARPTRRRARVGDAHHVNARARAT